MFWHRIKFLVGIVIPGWKCPEVLDLVLLTLFLVFRTFLSIYLAGVNGLIVKAIIEMDFGLFVRRVLHRLCRSSTSPSSQCRHPS